MFNLKRSNFSEILSKDVAIASVVRNEGTVLVRVLENGYEKVKESEGVTGEVIVGFAMTNNDDMLTEITEEDVTMSSASAGVCYAQLSHLNLVGTGATVEARVLDIGLFGTDGIQVSSIGSIDSVEKYNIDPATGILTCDQAQATQVLTVQYRYYLTVLEARAKFFERAVNVSAVAQLSQVAVGGGHGHIFTFEYDDSKNYEDSAEVPVILRSGPNGKVTVDGDGSIIPGRVIKTPNADDMSLGIAFNLSV